MRPLTNSDCPTVLLQVPRRVQVVAPKHTAVSVQPMSASKSPEGTSGSPGTTHGGPGSPGAGRGAGGISHKVAPGMEAVFTVVFCPEDDQDFAGGLVVITEREAFEVPVLGTGAALSTQASPSLLAPGTEPCPRVPRRQPGFICRPLRATKRKVFGSYCSDTVCRIYVGETRPRESDAALQDMR